MSIDRTIDLRSEKLSSPISISTGNRYTIVVPPKYIWIEVHHTLGLFESEPYKLEVNGKVTEGRTTADGVIEAAVPRNATNGTLTIGGHTYTLNLIDTNLGDDLQGAQIRLNNLGYNCGLADGTWAEMSRSALKVFQAKFNLPPTGEPDDESLVRLKEIHDLKDNSHPEATPAISEGDSRIPEEVDAEETQSMRRPEDDPSYFA